MGHVNVRVHRGQMSTVGVFLICVFLCGLPCLLVEVCVSVVGMVWLVHDGLCWATAVHCQCVREASHTRLWFCLTPLPPIFCLQGQLLFLGSTTSKTMIIVEGK